MAFGLMSGILYVIGWLFWEQEVQYMLPTPIPSGYEVVYVNEVVPLEDSLSTPLDRPKFYHFFKPDCPCSRFNVKHFNYLNGKYSDEIDFVVVIPEGSDISDAAEYFDRRITVAEDVGLKLANGFGVYSTPQAVIVSPERKLYFRGNYNRARYCTEPMSNYAQMALDSIINDRPSPNFGPLATVSYGCGLPEESIVLFNYQ